MIKHLKPRSKLEIMIRSFPKNLILFLLFSPLAIIYTALLFLIIIPIDYIIYKLNKNHKFSLMRDL